MNKNKTPKITIVDYGMGNIFSVKHACEYLGSEVSLASSSADLLASDGVILPGVGAFGDAMQVLKRLDLVSVLQDIAAMGKPLMGICLGIQLFMRESHEFGSHPGLAIIEGEVVRFEKREDKTLKVPHVGWNRIYSHEGRLWNKTPLEGLKNGDFVYFVHSFYAKPQNPAVILSTSNYGGIPFCSSIQVGNVFGCQFHPEKSGLQGLKILKTFLNKSALQGGFTNDIGKS